jgi:tryptophan-rich sensory protein
MGVLSHQYPTLAFTFTLAMNLRRKYAAFIGRLGFWSGTGKISKSCVFSVRTNADLNELAQTKEELQPMTWMEWYDSLAKPTWTPAPATIGLIWQILYPIIVVSFGFVFVQAIRKKLPSLVALPFAINLVANLIFTPIQFGMRNLPLAAVDILIVWGTIIWMSVAIWKNYRWVAVAQVPYFVWVSLATVLQQSITAMNWGRP